MSAALVKTDMQTLLRQPEFLRFLWRHAIQNGGIFEQVGDGSQGRDLGFYEGRRGLALEMLAGAELGQPIAHPERLPILTTIQILREQAQQATTEKVNGRHDRYDRHQEPDGDDEL
jgi:hypothetical protein